MNKALLLMLCLFTAFLSAAQVLNDPKEAFQQSAQSGKNVLLVFSGSDWCIPCIQFEKKILSDPAFEAFATQNLIVLKADFPQKKKIPEILKSQYEALADQYNPTGNFPYIILISPDKKLLGNFIYQQQSVATFISDLKKAAR